jgi:hypothetical protein
MCAREINDYYYYYYYYLLFIIFNVCIGIELNVLAKRLGPEPRIF